MRAWTAAERGGAGVDANGAIRCRDRHAYSRLRQVFSKEFMVGHWYLLDRDRKLPHELSPTKACKTCGVVKRNDYKEFQREPFGDRKLKRFTTADTCRHCTSRAVSNAQQGRVESERIASAAYDESGAGLWERKEP